MDLGSLKEQVSNLTLYDVKAGVRKLQNGRSIWGVNEARRMSLGADTWSHSRHELYRDGGQGASPGSVKAGWDAAAELGLGSRGYQQ